MEKGGRSKAQVLGLWVVTALLLPVAAVAGFLRWEVNQSRRLL